MRRQRVGLSPRRSGDSGRQRNDSDQAAVAPSAGQKKRMSTNSSRTADGERLIVFGPNARHHFVVIAASASRSGVAAAARGRPAQRRADQPQVLDARRARLAPAQMRFQATCSATGSSPSTNGSSISRALAAQIRNHDRSPSSSARSACRARVSRDFTVPTATSSVYAISS